MSTTTHEHDTGLTALLPVNPFRSLRYHFGMLLGVDDFETEQGYHRGRTSLHNAWLHRHGVVWGLAVSVDDEEIRVERGLALDEAGNEIYLDALACLSLPAWYAAHEDDPELVDVRTDTATGVKFDAHVVARFRPCLTRPVPAFADSCEGGASETTYSRVASTAELLLVPGPAPAGSWPYHRLRVLFGIDAADLPDDQPVLDAVAAIAALPAADQPAALLVELRRFAALDAIDLLPAESEEGEEALLFPGLDRTPLVLADVTGIALDRDGDDWVLAGAPAVDNTVRRTHVATATIQELLCGPGGLAGGGPIAPPAPASAGADAGGPRIDRASVAFASERRIVFDLDKPIEDGSAVKEAFRVSVLGDTGGWRNIGVAEIQFDEATNRITVALNRNPGEGLVRLVVRGTGATPVLGADGVPLGGETGGPAGGVHNGNDFVHMMRRS